MRAITCLSRPLYDQVDWICKYWPASEDPSDLNEHVEGYLRAERIEELLFTALLMV